MKLLKSQTSIEFMVFVSILLIILLVVFYNSSYFNISITNTRVYTEGKNLADSIASEINTAVFAGGGYSRKFIVQNDIFGITNFTIIVNNYDVIVDWGSSFASSSIVIPNLNGAISNGWVNINNTGGLIYVS